MLSRAQSSVQTIVEEDTLRIGQLAASASVGVETLRFYEREGLLERPYQNLSGYRAYPIAAVAKVQTIKRAQALGFTLAEIRELLKGTSSGLLAEQATKKLREIDATIAELALVRQQLVQLTDHWCDRLLGCSCGQPDCPVHRSTADPISQSMTPVPLSAPPKRRGVVAGGLAAAACGICCTPLVAGLLAALGWPAFAAGEGA
jgi:DNA-binding transcriptional MerR regulator